MSIKLTASFLVLSSLALLPATSVVQNASAQDKSDQEKSDVRTLKGCLEKGGHSGEYNLMADDGSTWVLKSDTVKMARHIGHTITVTGAVSHPEMHSMKEKAKGDVSDKPEHGHLTVTQLKMDSDSCKQ